MIGSCPLPYQAVLPPILTWVSSSGQGLPCCTYVLMGLPADSGGPHWVPEPLFHMCLKTGNHQNSSLTDPFPPGINSPMVERNCLGITSPKRENVWLIFHILSFSETVSPEIKKHCYVDILMLLLLHQKFTKQERPRRLWPLPEFMNFWETKEQNEMVEHSAEALSETEAVSPWPKSWQSNFDTLSRRSNSDTLSQTVLFR